MGWILKIWGWLKGNTKTALNIFSFVRTMRKENEEKRIDNREKRRDYKQEKKDKKREFKLNKKKERKNK